MKKRFLLILALSSACWAQPQVITGLTGGSVTGVVVSVSPVQMPVGGTAQGDAQVVISGALNVDETRFGLWSSQCPAAATVNSSGLVTGVSSAASCAGGVTGQATIQFVIGAFSGTAVVQVGNPPLISQASMKSGSCPAQGGTLCALNPDASNTVAYGFQFSATGGVPYTGVANGGYPYTWSCTAGCSGQTPNNGSSSALTLGTSSGLLSGTAGVAGDYPFTVQVTDSVASSTTLQVTLHIAGAAGSGPPGYNGSITSSLIVPEFPNPAVPVIPLLTAGCTVNGVTTSCNNLSGGIPVAVTDDSWATWVGTANLSKATRCTDARSAQDNLNRNFAAGIGGSSLFNLVNANSTITGVDAAFEYFTLLKKDGSSNYYCAAPTNPAPSDHANCNATTSCSIFITQASDMVINNGSLANKTENFGSGDFDLTDPSVWWAFGLNTFETASSLHVNKVTFAGSGTPDGSFTYPNAGGIASPVVDFQYGLPLGTNAPEWAPGQSYAYGAYVTHTLNNQSVTGARVPEYRKWLANTAYAAGDLIVPGDSDACPSSPNTTNPNAIAYKATVAGTTGSSCPNFGSKNVGNASNTVTDGTEKWQGINSQAKFVFQNTGAAGVACNNPVDGILNNWLYRTTLLHPDLMSGTANPDCNGIFWTNVGPNYIPSAGAAWVTTGGVSSDQTKFATAVSSNSYGPMANGKYSGTAIQNTGIFAIEAMTSDPWFSGHAGFALLNTGTGIQSNVNCPSGMTLANCVTNGSASYWSAPGPAFNAVINPLPAGPSTPGPNCDFTIHNDKITTDGLGMFLTMGLLILNPTGPCTGVQNFYEWLPLGLNGTAVYDGYVNLQIYSDGMPHFANGKNTVCASHNGGYGQSSGVMIACHPVTNASGNHGGLPPGCGVGPGQTACLLYSGSQPTFVLSPYSLSIAGTCAASTIPNTGTGGNGNWPATGIAQNAYGKFPPTISGGAGNPACNISNVWDWHFDWAYNPSFADGGTLWGISNNSAANVPVPIAPWENELTGWPTATITTNPPITTGQVKRAFHTYAVGTSNNFSINVQISSGALDGTVNLFGSDWNCQFGSTGPQAGSLNTDGKPTNDGSGELGHLPAAYAAYYGQPATVLSFCGFPWQANYPYVVGNLIDPTPSGATSNGSGGFDVFQAVAASGGTLCLTVPCSGASSTYSALSPLFKGSNPPTAHVIATAADAGSTATYTFSANPGIVAGQSMNITSCSVGGYNGASLTAATVGPTTVTVAGISGLGAATGCSIYGIGTKIPDNGMIWQDVGPQNQRGDVVVITLR